jgi:integrase/recombinase XerD
VIEIPTKRHERTLVSYLNRDEIKALLAAPDRTQWLGRRDHALLLVAIQTGLRVSELVGLRVRDVTLGTGAHVRTVGKRRKERCVTLTHETVAVLREWLKERAGEPDDPPFPTRRGRPLNTDTTAELVAKHAATAASDCPSLATKRVTPHVLRHYVDGWVMWPVGAFAVAGVSRGLVPAT